MGFVLCVMSDVKKKGVFLIALGMLGILGVDVHAAEDKVWERVCADEKNAETCHITQQLYMTQKGEDGKPAVTGRVLGLTILHIKDAKTKKRAPYLSVQMPLGVDLRPGAVLKVDDGEEVALEFLRCTNAGCDASIKLDDKLLKSFKKGSDVFVGFRPWGGAQTSVVKVSLKGFSKTYSYLK